MEVFNMVKVYLDNKSYWFNTLEEAKEFIKLNGGSFKEFNQYWNAVTKNWENK